MTAIPILNINEDFLRRFTVQGVRASDGQVVDATGLSLEVRIAATPTGPAIGSLTVFAIEYVDEPGFYHADFDMVTLITDLTTRVGSHVYVIVRKVGDMDCVWWKYRVANNRQAG